MSRLVSFECKMVTIRGIDGTAFAGVLFRTNGIPKM